MLVSPARTAGLTLALLLATLPLGGCAVGLATSAVGAIARAAEDGRAPMAQEDAVAACLSHAAQYGRTAFIDAERRSHSKLVVWGTAGEGQTRRSFECSYTGRVSGFKLRPAPQPATR